MSSAAVPKVVGVVGAGTMGGGIAQLAVLAGARTLLHDPVPEALERGAATLRANLAKGAERGRWSAEQAEAASARLEPVAALEDLAPCELVIEAAPERLDLKRELFGRLAALVAPDCVLASNTSSIPITAIAGAVAHPERVVGMHFFNPAPLMRLLEVVAGEDSGAAALARARALGEAMGKVVIDAADGPGFLVNRANRPFSLEALKLVTERVASVEQVDRVARLGGGFRMGPFELMDLVGVDVGFDVAKSFHELSFGEPRWRPSPLSARMVAAGRTGRKSGRGFYDYRDGRHRPDDPAEPPRGEPPSAPGGPVVVVAGEIPLAHLLLERASDAGWDARTPAEADGEVPFLILDCGASEDDPPLQGGPQAICLHEGSLAALDPGGAAVGFHALPPLERGGLVELTRGPDSLDAAAAAAERFFATLGLHTEWVGDAPGLVLGRIVCQLVNEAAFAVGEGVGTPADLDAGMVHGLNHPRGPLAWGDAIGLDHVLSVLDALWDEQREERYRAAPPLRRLVLCGRLGQATGEGFFTYDDEEID
ncbi:MAG TPA: 3-hydroxyacyl-CoA dehydrogenase NAD-binding domain-containing protein [Conexibacter sp.]|nr:3-hydroxyacyl-CoA dehydrogenase NAD-binding domain-containing protein [Conexibacter sp.]